MALFKCKSSGNIFEFVLEHDIKTMRTHPEYEEINYTVVSQEDTQDQAEKKLGRPRKVKE